MSRCPFITSLDLLISLAVPVLLVSTSIVPREGGTYLLIQTDHPGAVGHIEW